MVTLTCQFHSISELTQSTPYTSYIFCNSTHDRFDSPHVLGVLGLITLLFETGIWTKSWLRAFGYHSGFWLEGGPARKVWLRSGGASVLWPSSPSSSQMSVKIRWSLSLLLSFLCSTSPLTTLVWGEMDSFLRQFS